VNVTEEAQPLLDASNPREQLCASWFPPTTILCEWGSARIQPAQNTRVHEDITGRHVQLVLKEVGVGAGNRAQFLGG
jgi:hypothetical protein